MSTRRIPPRSPLSEPYWQAAANGELVMQYCGSCNVHAFPPRAHCAQCGNANLLFQKVSGMGSVYTYTVAYRPPHPVFAEQCPLVIAVVELSEGPRLMTNIVDCDPESVHVGMSVEVTFEPIDDSDIKLPVFKPC